MKTLQIKLKRDAEKKHSWIYKAESGEGVQSIYVMKSIMDGEEAPKTLTLTLESDD